MRGVTVPVLIYSVCTILILKVWSQDDFACRPPLFKCRTYCINPDFVCDGYNDCDDDEDYLFCSNNTCPEYAFQCHSGACVDGDVVCNTQKDCADYSDECYHLCKWASDPVYEGCGVFESDDSKTIFPWHAGVWLQSPGGPKRQCAATIISTVFAISIAECFWDSANNKLKEDIFTFVAGYNGEQYTQIRNVVNIKLSNNFMNSHSDWTKNFYNYALLKLDKTLEFGKYVQAACIDQNQPELHHDYDIQGTMVSWSIGPGKTQQPQQLNVSYYKECQSKLNAPEKLPDVLHKPCLSSSECGPFSDQGAGLFVVENGSYYLRGILNPPIGDETVLLCNYRLFSLLNNNEVQQLLTTLVEKVEVENEEEKTDECPEYAFVCHSGECIDKDLLCNDKSDCPDGSDESYHLCKRTSEPVYENCGQFYSNDSKTIFPWHAGIWMKISGSLNRLCSATIVSPLFAISISDCFWDYQETKLKEDDLTLVAGYDGVQFTQIRKVAYIAIHNAFKSSFSNWTENTYNYAILVLESRLQFDEYVKAACIDKLKYQDFDIQGTMISWSIGPGKTQEPEQLNVSYYKECQSKLNIPEQLPTLFRKPCLYSNECGPVNDQGAGVFVLENDTYYLRGILNPPIGDETVLLCNYRLFSLLEFNVVQKLLEMANNYAHVTEREKNTGGCWDYEFKCKSKECIPGEKVCDGMKDCSNGFDEDENVCTKESYLHLPCGYLKTDTDERPFPWHAEIWEDHGTNDIRICGATIISAKYAISATDCFWDESQNGFRTDLFKITGGHKGDSLDQVRNISRIINYGYQKNVGRLHYINNLALLELETPFNMNDHVNAVCVDLRPAQYQYIYSKLYPKTMSLNKTLNNAPSNVNLFDKGKFYCHQRLPSQYDIPIGQDKLCFASHTCLTESDTGSGVFVKRDGVYYLQGVLDRSFGKIYCTTNLVTNIIPYADFIKQEVEKNTHLADFTVTENAISLRANPSNFIAIHIHCPKENIQISRICKETKECRDDPFFLKCDIIEFPLYKSCYMEYCFDNTTKCTNNYYCSNVTYTCGKFDNTDTTSPFPWHASLWLENLGTPRRICAATILSEYYVLTAADCFAGLDSFSEFELKNYVVSVGYKGEFYDQFSVVKNLNLKTFSTNKLALLRLETRLKFNSYVAPICLLDKNARSSYNNDSELRVREWIYYFMELTSFVVVN